MTPLSLSGAVLYLAESPYEPSPLRQVLIGRTRAARQDLLYMTARRHGLLSASADGTILGHPGKRHILLSPDGISWRLGRNALDAYAWEEVEQLLIDVPTTRSRVAANIAEIVLGPITMAIPALWDVEPPAGSFLVSANGDVTTLDVDRHHLGGYWRPIITATQDLLNRLVLDPPTRTILAEPHKVLAMVARGP